MPMPMTISWRRRLPAFLWLSKVQGQLCHHLAFRQEDIDWQIWIENGPTPLPRKFLITDKKAKGLQVTALLPNGTPHPSWRMVCSRLWCPQRPKKSPSVR